MAERSNCNCCCHGNAPRHPVTPAYPPYPSYYPAYPFPPPHIPYPYPYPPLGPPAIGHSNPPAVGLPHYPYFPGYYPPHPTHVFPGYPHPTIPPAAEPATKSECCKKQERASDKTSVKDVRKMKNKLENLSKYGQYSWVPTNIREDNSFVIEDGLLIGTDVHGSDIYAARAKFSGDMIPGKYVPTTNICTVTMCGEEASVDDFEVLIPSSFKWVAAMNGAVPPGAVPAGVCANGEKYYYGRVKHNDALIPGKMQPSHGNSYYGIDGNEFSSKKYEILVLM